MLMTQFFTALLTLHILQLIFNNKSSTNHIRPSLIPDETKYMLFTHSRNPTDNITQSTTLEGLNIERATRYKYLGNWLDEQFTLKSHINSTVTKLRQLEYFYRHRTNFPLAHRKHIIEAILMLDLEYRDVI